MFKKSGKTIPLLVYQKGTEYRALAKSTALEVCKRYPKLKIAIKAETSVPVKENMHQYYRRYTTSVIRQLKQRQRERQKKQWPQINNTLATLHVHHAFLVHFFAVWLHDYDVILLKLGSLSDGDGDGHENDKKVNRADWQNNNFARASRFLVHFFAVVARLQRESA